jgi:hypothetical protein
MKWAATTVLLPQRHDTGDVVMAEEMAEIKVLEKHSLSLNTVGSQTYSCPIRLPRKIKGISDLSFILLRTLS